MVDAGLVKQGGTPAGYLQVVSPQFQGPGLLKKDYKGMESTQSSSARVVGYQGPLVPRKGVQ